MPVRKIVPRQSRVLKSSWVFVRLGPVVPDSALGPVLKMFYRHDPISVPPFFKTIIFLYFYG